MEKMRTIDVLAKAALLGSGAVAFTGYVLNKNFEIQARKTITYKRALEILRNHKTTVDHLGEPIKEGKVIFDTSEEFRKFDVNLKGSKTGGKLNCEYLVKPDKKTEITKVEIKFSDIPNKIFVIHEI